MAYPAPGPVVDFTDDRLRVKRAMQSVVGTQLRFMSKFNIGLSEAIDISQRSDDRVLFIVISRECRGLRGQALDECGREVVVETRRWSRACGTIAKRRSARCAPCSRTSRASTGRRRWC